MMKTLLMSIALFVAGANLAACRASSCENCTEGGEGDFDPGVPPNSGCGDVQIDSANCGSCGYACPSNHYCREGVCVPTCPSGQVACEGRCIQPKTDRLHCGAKNDCAGVNQGSSCVGEDACVDGACVACVTDEACVPDVPCKAGRRSCSGSKCTVIGDLEPGTACGDSKVCANGSCIAVDRVLTLISGDAQSAIIDAQLAEPVVVHLADGEGSPVSGAPVEVEATAGAFASTAITDAGGNAKIVARVGRSTGIHTFTATALAAAKSLHFTATAVAPAPKTIFTVANVAHASGEPTAPGPATVSKLDTATGVAATSDGTLYLASKCAVYALSNAGVLTIVAGNPASCGNERRGAGRATEALLSKPNAVALDEANRQLFISDQGNRRILRVDLSSGSFFLHAGGRSSPPSAGYGDGGPATDAYLNPSGIAAAPNGDVYVSDATSGIGLRRIQAGSGFIETVVSPRACTTGIEFSSCGGAGDRCSFAWDSKGQLFFGAHFCVPKAGTVRGIARLLSDGTLALVAGASASDGSVSDGVAATAAYFPSIPQILFDKAGNLLASVSAANRVRRIDAATHRVTTLVGDGDAGYRGDYVEARLAALNHPKAIAIDGSGTLHIADDANDAVRSVWQLGDTVASTAQMVFPSGSGGSQFIDSFFPGPLSVTMKDGSNRDLPGVEVTWRSHTPGAGILDAPSPSRSLALKTDLAGKSMMRGRLGRAPGNYTFTASYTDIHGDEVSGSPATFTLTAVEPEPGTIFTIDNVSRARVLSGVPGPAIFAQHSGARGSAAASDGTLYLSVECAVLKLTPAGELSVLAGDPGACGRSADAGPAKDAKLFRPTGLALDETRGILYIADMYNDVVWAVDLSDDWIQLFAGGGSSTLAPDGGGVPATAAALSLPTSVSVDPTGDVYVVDADHHAIWRVSHLSGFIYPWVYAAHSCDGSRMLSSIGGWTDVLWSGQSGDAYFSAKLCGAQAGEMPAFGIVLRKADGTLTHIAGKHQGDANDGVSATSAFLPGISGIALAPNGDIAVATGEGDRVRLIDMHSGSIRTVAGNGYAGVSTTSDDYVPATRSPISFPFKIAFTREGHLIIPEYYGHCFREVW